GKAGNPEITEASADFQKFTEALKGLCIQLARAMAKDGEGADKLLVCSVSGAVDDRNART
ncbi:MAG TPA: arginine biosynthesis protein ArgJ, partial [Ruminococcaceae bacterium]|nr:arginine biosynthesis protein ArgJ [Oscillospiraceae bacterium]